MIRKNFLVACIAAVAIHEVAANSLTQGKEKTNADKSSHGQRKGKGQSPALIQTSIQSSNHTCLFSQDRNKAALPDFNAIEKGTQLYSDPDFTPDNSSIFWADRGEGESEGDHGLSYQASTITWKRASYYYKDHSLFGTNGIGPEDITQGMIGNCWFMSAAAALAEFPGRIEKIFQNSGSELNANGIYALNFYTLGVPHTVIIDDYLPLTKSGTGFTTIFAQVGKDNDLWGPLLEKAFAKYHGNYTHTMNGAKGRALRTLTNAPYERILHNRDAPTQQEIDTDWDLLQSSDLAANIMQTQRPLGGFNLLKNHVYSVLGVATLSNGQRLVKMRNPWGVELFNGDWSRHSDLWTDALRAEVGEDLRQDGIFFMAHKDFYNQFEDTTITYNTEGWHSSHFLMLDDTTSVPGSKWSQLCGLTCTRHNMKLTSDVDQTVFVTAQTWDVRASSRDCRDTPRKLSLLGVLGPSFQSGYAFEDQGFLPSFEMKAGETFDLYTEWDWTSPEIAHDWSVLAWGNKGPITITHNEGLESMSLPVIYGIDPPTSKGDTTTTTITTPVETKFGKELRLWQSKWEPNVEGFWCNGDKKYEYLEDRSDGKKELMVFANSCPDTLFIFSIWMKTQEWDGVEFYKDFDAQGNELVHTTPTKCNVDADDASLTVCEWLVGDPKLGGVPRGGYVQTKGDNYGITDDLITWTKGEAVVESKFGKELRESVNDWDTDWANWVCKDTIWYKYLDDKLWGTKELFQAKNECPDSLFTLKVWMKTQEWDGVEFYKDFDAQGNELVHTTPKKCNVDAADAELTVCEWLVGDPKHGGVPRMGYVQTQGNNYGYKDYTITWDIGGRVAK